MSEDSPIHQAMAAVLKDAAGQMRQTLARRATSAGAAELVGAGALIRDVEAWADRIAAGAGWTRGVAAGTPFGAPASSDTIIGYGLEHHPRKGPFLCEYREDAT